MFVVDTSAINRNDAVAHNGLLHLQEILYGVIRVWPVLGSHGKGNSGWSPVQFVSSTGIEPGEMAEANRVWPQRHAVQCVISRSSDETLPLPGPASFAMFAIIAGVIIFAAAF